MTSAGLHAWLSHQLAAEAIRHAAAALAPEARVMPLKGALLGRMLYDSPSERPISDGDLLVMSGSLGRAVARLERAGFVVVAQPRVLHAAVLVSPRAPDFPLDLHTRPLPVGMGAVDADWLGVGARDDTALFGASVVLPDERRLLVHLLGNVVKDHVFRARPHHAEDVRRLLARSRYAPADFAAVIADARLRAACWMALEWIAETAEGAQVRAVQAAIGLRPREERWARWRLEQLRRAAAREPPPLGARLLARTVADAPRDAVAGLAVTAAVVLRDLARRARADG